MKKRIGQIKRGPHRQEIITDEAQVPAGWIRMVDLVKRHGKSTSGFLSTATLDGRIPSVKIRKYEDQGCCPVFLDPVIAEEILLNRKRRGKENDPLPATSPPSQATNTLPIGVPTRGEWRAFLDRFEKVEKGENPEMIDQIAKNVAARVSDAIINRLSDVMVEKIMENGQKSHVIQ